MSDISKNSCQVYKLQLEMLEGHNEEYRRQIEVQKRSNETLLAAMANFQVIKSENTQLSLQNRQLKLQLDSQRKRNEDLQGRFQIQIRNLKEELMEKVNYIQRIKVQHQKQIFKVGDELRKSKIQQRQQRYENMEDQLARSSMAVTSCLIDLKPRQENSLDYSNRMSIINMTNLDRTSSKIQVNSRLSEFKKEKGEISRARYDSDFRNYTREELKTAIKTLNRAGKNLKQGSMQMSVMRKSQSFLKKNGL